MPPLTQFTTKAKEAIKRAHELAIERAQNNVNTLHLLASLLVQEDSNVITLLDRLEVDTILLTDSVLESIEAVDGATTVAPSYQMFLTGDLAQTIEHSLKVATELKDNFVSTEHLFVALLDIKNQASELLDQFTIDRASLVQTIIEYRSNKMPMEGSIKKCACCQKYTRNLTKLAREDKLDRSSVVTVKYCASCKYCLAVPKTTPFSWENRVLAKLRWWKGLPTALPKAMLLNP